MATEKKTLVIVESPTKAETIRKYLPKNYVVAASKGHVRDLPADSMGIDIEHGFAPQYVITEGKEALIQDLRKKLKDSGELLLATDEDREGESISWHLLELLKPKVPYRRMVFHEITRSAIAEALEKGRDIDSNLVKAQEDRRIIDRLYGFEVSPVLWRKLSNKKLSGGRVQSVGLRLIVEKELDRLRYKSSTYCDLKADFGLFSASLESVEGKRVAGSKDFDSSTGEFNGRSLLLEREDCDRLVGYCNEHKPYVVSSVVSKPSVSNPQPPFTTSTLQQAASSRLHLSSRETMRIAQSLFENGFITYMRTDSVNLSDECIKASREQIEAEFGAQYLAPSVRRFKNRSKNAQEAHEAIRPAGDSFRRPEETGLKGKELALYALIWMRTLATQMASARKSTTSVRIACGDVVFAASGTVIVFPGYLRVYSDEEKEEKGQSLPELKEGDELADAVLTVGEHVTSPPGRYSEASLIRSLEEQGVGRPSTYATIISTLLDRGYVREQDRAMIPTFTGFAVNACMESAFSRLVDYSYTSDMEDELDRIAAGEEDSLSYLERFYYGDDGNSGLKAMVAQARSSVADYKTLTFPHFSGKAQLSDGRTCSYSVKIGPYGAYVATDIVGEDGKAKLVNLPSHLLPGQMVEADLVRILDSAICGVSQPSSDEIVLRDGRRGPYWQKDDRVCLVPKGKRKAEDYSVEEIDYLLSLPVKVALDADGNEITLNKGPYGFYLKCGDKNYRVYKVPFNMTEAEALDIVSRTSASGSILRTFDDFNGRPLSARKGKFGPFLKWGEDNVRLPKGTDLEALSQEEAQALCLKSAKPAEGGVLGKYEGQDIVLARSRYGIYLKWNGGNYSLTRQQAASIDYDVAVSVLKKAQEANTPSSLGEKDGSPVELVSGRYGRYLRWKGNNYRLPSGQEEVDLSTALSLIAQQDARRQEEGRNIATFEGEPVTLAHGRYGYYLKWKGVNIGLPEKYKQSVEGLGEQEAVELVEKRKKS